MTIENRWRWLVLEMLWFILRWGPSYPGSTFACENYKDTLVNHDLYNELRVKVSKIQVELKEKEDKDNGGQTR